jgi:hypothetical protein
MNNNTPLFDPENKKFKEKTNKRQLYTIFLDFDKF